MSFSFMTNKQIKNSSIDFFSVFEFSRFIAQPCTIIANSHWCSDLITYVFDWISLFSTQCSFATIV